MERVNHSKPPTTSLSPLDPIHTYILSMHRHSLGQCSMKNIPPRTIKLEASNSAQPPPAHPLTTTNKHSNIHHGPQVHQSYPWSLGRNCGQGKGHIYLHQASLEPPEENRWPASHEHLHQPRRPHVSASQRPPRYPKRHVPGGCKSAGQ
ncbi:hypothetical protein LZ31DRAFT_136015 [Colletotrichum somersetense]|nr:hypothetical protein LZ31DRAFT_136015 [Colletotrichum somersetense]